MAFALSCLGCVIVILLSVTKGGYVYKRSIEVVTFIGYVMCHAYKDADLCRKVAKSVLKMGYGGPLVSNIYSDALVRGFPTKGDLWVISNPPKMVLKTQKVQKTIDIQ